MVSAIGPSPCPGVLSRGVRVTSVTARAQAEQRVSPSGLGFAAASYTWWGLLPLWFVAALPMGPVELVAWRIVLSLGFCFLLLAVVRGWRPLARILRDGRSMALLAAGSVLILINWLVYVFAALNQHVVEASLGYFINPIVTVLLGVLVLHERLRPLQWISVGISVIAVLVLATGSGGFPWISLGLAASFGSYGLIKKRVGGTVDAISGLTMETAILTPFAIALLAFMAFTGVLVAGTASLPHTLLLSVAGVLTAVPLLLFAAAARRLPLTILGLTQYIAPAVQFIIGVVVLQEHMAPARWIGFALVWVALAVLTADMVGSPRRSRRALIEPT